jgi:hypothetical protein
LDTVSSDQGSSTPSFDDLFDDPHAPLVPVDLPGRAATPSTTAPSASPRVVITTGPSVSDAAPAPVAPAAPTHHQKPAGDDAHSIPDVAGPDRTSGVVVAATAAGVVVEPPLVTATTESPVDSPEVSLAAPVESPAPARSIPVPATPATSDADWDGHTAVEASSAPAARVDTGRLYRSAGAEGPATLDAIPAIDPGYRPAARVETSAETAAPRPGTGAGLTYTGVVVVVVGATALVGLADALVTHRIGLLTCLALAASSIYAAIVVRRPDIWAAVVVPPLAFLAALLIGGQLTLGGGSKVSAEGFMIFRGLSDNAPWILGVTLVCLVIVLVRRRRA